MTILMAVLLWRDYLLYNKVELCGVDTAKLPVLTEEQKHDLLLKIR